MKDTNKKLPSLRTRVVRALVLLFAGMFAIFYLLFFISMQRMLELREKKSSLALAQISKSMILSSVEEFPTKGKDWAVGNDLYYFAQGRNATFEESDLNDTAFRLYWMNLVAVLDTEGNPIFNKRYDYQRLQYYYPPDNGLATLQKLAEKAQAKLINSQKATGKADLEGVSGFLNMPDGLYYVAAFPILHTDLSGPSPGTLIIGRRMDEEELARLGLHLDFTFNLLPEDELLLDEQQLAELQENENIVLPQQDDTIFSAILLQDALEENSIALTVSRQRIDFAEERNFINRMLFLLALGCIGVLLLIIRMLDVELHKE